jgi:hypothetical protein
LNIQTKPKKNPSNALLPLLFAMYRDRERTVVKFEISTKTASGFRIIRVFKMEENIISQWLTHHLETEENTSER